MLSCPRGAASPAAHTQRRLFAASAGYCQNPGCQCALFVDLPGKAIHIAEMAHVFAAQDHGPRASAKLTKTQRGAFENLVLLCANCHTMVDKAPDQFCDATMLGWKRDHAVKLQALFGVTKYSDRIAARAAIEPLLRENHTIFDQYGPHIAAAVNPESGAQDLWGRKMLVRILPNNRRVLALLDANQHLLRGQETATVEVFRQHVDDLEARHIEGYNEDGARFPAEMASILKG